MVQEEQKHTDEQQQQQQKSFADYTLRSTGSNFRSVCEQLAFRSLPLIKLNRARPSLWVSLQLVCLTVLRLQIACTRRVPRTQQLRIPPVRWGPMAIKSSLVLNLLGRIGCSMLGFFLTRLYVASAFLTHSSVRVIKGHAASLPKL